ncbi:dynein axonemal intermediate chain 7 isoform X2 [Brienomyrus brachyistius]|uniref:dynein axonemal intermediate chain 7 isoform X2 n=1 Tax=Brienomyrus brachyistius TaxID=42636 RepID=UPI0020B36F7F|nr:dynein axonemal intermediate chain 7 isoform X2 [Brienomyrus brachyistius]
MSANKRRDKLSKVEKKKLQKEEDEQRQREEEAARLLAEQEELQRQEEERKEQEEHQRLELKDRERREDELSELRHLLDEMQNAVARWKHEASAKTKWERYMRCDGTPDPSIPHEINGFISLWNEDTEVQIAPVLESCSLAQRLIEELEDLLSETPQSAGSSSDTHRHQETILSLQELIHSKHNQATEEILKWSRANMDIETGNTQTVVRDADVTLCLWANLNKNPRFKGYHFHEAGFGFELPKQLAVSDVAVRILHTRFDHLSCLSAGAHHISQGSIKTEESHPSTVEEGDGDKEQQGSTEESLDYTDEDSVRSETRKVRCTEHVHTGSRMNLGRNESKDWSCSARMQLMYPSYLGWGKNNIQGFLPSSVLLFLNVGTGVRRWKMMRNGYMRTQSFASVASEKEEKNGRHVKELEEQRWGEARRDSLQEETAIAGERDSYFPPEPPATLVETEVVDLHQYTPLGGVFYFDAFRIPPQSQLVNGWDVRELSDTGLQRFPYPVDESQLHSSTSRPLDEGGALVSPPVGVTVTLPNSAVFLEDPQVARWDPVACQWTRESIGNITYDASLKRISFQMDSFYPFTLLQDMHINMPFQSWELRPLGLNSAVLVVTAAVTEVHFTVKGHHCMLSSATEYELPHVLGRWMSPSALQKAVRRAGLDVFASESSEKYVSIDAKEPSIAQAAYEQMALLSCAVAFSWSRWNSHCGREQLVVQACEHLEAGPVPEKAWSLYLLNAERTCRLRIREQSESFSTALDGGSEFHATLLHMLRDGMGAPGHGRVRDADPFFVDCVLQLLMATRVLSYC